MAGRWPKCAREARKLAGFPGLLGLFLVLLQSVSYAQNVYVSGNPGALVVGSTVAGLQPAPVTDASTVLSYDTDNTGSYRIVATLDRELPPGLTLQIKLGSRSFQTLSLSGIVLVDNIPPNTPLTQETITYRLSATVVAGVIPTTARVITFTVEPVP